MVDFHQMRAKQVSITRSKWICFQRKSPSYSFTKKNPKLKNLKKCEAKLLALSKKLFNDWNIFLWHGVSSVFFFALFLACYREAQMSSLHFECLCSALGWLNNEHKRWNIHLYWEARDRNGITSPKIQEIFTKIFFIHFWKVKALNCVLSCSSTVNSVSTE